MILLKRNRQGNYSAGTLLIVKPKVKGGVWTLLNGSTRRSVIGTAPTFVGAKNLIPLTFKNVHEVRRVTRRIMKRLRDQDIFDRGRKAAFEAMVQP